MEISSAPNAFFRILTEEATIFVTRDGELPDARGEGETKPVLLAAAFKPASDGWDDASADAASDGDAIRVGAPGEYEIGSAYIIGVPSPTVAREEQTAPDEGIDMIYAIDSGKARICAIGQLTALPNRKTTDALAATYSAECVLVNLEQTHIAMAALADFVRGLDAKQLVARANTGDPKLVALTAELGLGEAQALNAFTVKPRPSQEKLVVAAVAAQ